MWLGSRNGWNCLLVVSLLLASNCVFAAQTKRARPKPPSVFLVTIDTLRADHIHCYGYNNIQTPALDSLASDGILFTNAFTPAPITTVSHASILTGLLPSSHGVSAFGMPLAANHPTMAELLRQNGYLTSAFIGAIVLDSMTLAPGFDRGFDFYDNFPRKPTGANSFRGPRWGRIERRGLQVVKHAKSWLNAHPSGPRFMWVHLYDPHDPYEPPPPFSRQYRERLYDGEIAYADFALADFLHFLKLKGWYQSSIVIVVGDHGEGLGEHGEQTHGIFLYDSTTRVPLIIKVPNGLLAHTVIPQQVRTTDILPTVLELVGLPSLPTLDGASLKALYEGTQHSERIVFGASDYPLTFDWAPLRSVRRDGIKYIEAPRPELYDLKTDPDELHNSYQPWDDRLEKIRGLLAAGRSMTPSPAAVRPTTLEELKALGYVGRADKGSSTSAPEPSLLPDPKDKIEEQNLLHSAMIAGEANRLADARRALEKTLQLDPDAFAAIEGLAGLDLQTGRFSEAASHLIHAHEIHPNDASVTFQLGRALQKNGALDAARDALLSSLEVEPDHFEARLLLGQVQLALTNAKEAEDQLQAALMLQPRSLEAVLGLARAEIERDHAMAAVERLETISPSHPRNAEVFDLLGQAFKKMGNEKKAREAESRARQIRRAHPTKS